jgi:hypothetical protein
MALLSSIKTFIVGTLKWLKDQIFIKKIDLNWLLLKIDQFYIKIAIVDSN